MSLKMNYLLISMVVLTIFVTLIPAVEIGKYVMIFINLT